MCLAVPGRVEKIENNTAVVDFGGLKKVVYIDLFPDLSIGDYVLVHAGFVIQKVDEAEAKKTLEEFKKIYEIR